MQCCQIFPLKFECLSLTILAIFSSIYFSVRGNCFIRSPLSSVGGEPSSLSEDYLKQPQQVETLSFITPTLGAKEAPPCLVGSQ
jgi:hypothetical protein